MIRALGHADIKAIASLEQRAVARPWSAVMIEDELKAQGACFGFMVDEALAGWMALREQLDELWLFQLAVAPAQRRQGIGARLLRYAIQEVLKPAQPLLLEVRASNQAAQALYRQHGFTEIARRPGYYPPQKQGAPQEAAVLMRLSP